MKRIICPKNYLTFVKDQNSFIVATRVKNCNSNLLEKLGFSIPLKVNESIKPNPITGKTNENINGKIVVRKDLAPNEPYIRVFHWKCTDWNGDEHEGFTTKVKYRYPRQHLPAYNESMTIREDSQNELWICSDALSIDDLPRVKFVMNLFANTFHTFEILEKDLSLAKKIIKQNFWFLRPGTINREDLEKIICQGNKNKSAESIKAWERFQTIEPFMVANEIMVGSQGFYGYYAVKTKNYWVLESNKINNATYLFDDNWSDYVKFDKQQVIHGKLCQKRIYHTQNWKQDIVNILK